MIQSKLEMGWALHSTNFCSLGPGMSGNNMVPFVQTGLSNHVEISVLDLHKVG